MHISIFTNFGALNSGPVFAAFEQGCKKNRIRVSQNNMEADVAVIWSQVWQGRMAGNRQVWETFRSSGRNVIVLEVGMLNRGVTWKVGVNGTNANAYWGEGNEPGRVSKLNLKLYPWQQGKQILITVQRNDSYQWEGMPDTQQWVESTVTELKKYTDRLIVVRPHPRQILRQRPGFTIVKPVKLSGTYDDFNFVSELKNTWAVINHNSGPGSQAIMHGVPAFVNASSLASPVANLSIADIEKPAMPDRTSWLEQLSHTEWTVGEIASGRPLARLLDYLKTN